MSSTQTREVETPRERIAVYVAGDENIFFPAIVALQSIRRHNANLPFDYYLSFSRERLTNSMRSALHARGIAFVAREEYEGLADTSDLRTMSEGKWPTEIFDNWVAPHYFAKVGYRYALKVDYDFLCVAPYRYEDLLSARADIRSVLMEVDLAKQHVEESVFPRMGLELQQSFSKAPYTNVGFVAVNLENYVEHGVFAAFAKTYAFLREEKSEVLLCEQAALSVLMSAGKVVNEGIDPNYNVRIVTLPPVDGSGRVDVRNLHYATHHKPWLKVDYRWFDKYVPVGKTSVYLYRDLWVRTAAQDPLYWEYVNLDPHDDLAALAPIVKVLRAHIQHAK